MMSENDERSPESQRGLVPALCAATAVIVVFAIYSSASYFRLSTGANPYKASYFYLIAIAAAFAGVLATRGANLRRGIPWGLLAGFASFALLTWISYASGGSSPEVTYVASNRLIFAFMLPIFTLLLSQVPTARPIRIAFGAAFTIACVINVVELYDPGILPWRMSKVAGRAAGFYEDPNLSALFIASAIPILGLGRSLRIRLALVTLALVGAAATFSRSGLLVWALASSLTIFLPERHKLTGNTLRSLIAAACLLILIFLFRSFLLEAAFEFVRPLLNADTAHRLQGTLDHSVLERSYVARRGLAAFSASPLVGQGAGYTRVWGYGVSVHNMVVLMLAEYGLVGILVYGFISFQLFRIPYPFGIVLGPIFLVSSLFFHVLFDNAIYALLIAAYWRLAMGVRPATVVGSARLLRTRHRVSRQAV